MDSVGVAAAAPDAGPGPAWQSKVSAVPAPRGRARPCPAPESWRSRRRRSTEAVESALRGGASSTTTGWLSLGRATRARFAATGNYLPGGESCCDSLITALLPSEGVGDE